MPGDVENGSSGKPHRLFGTVQDITELKRAEDARRLCHKIYKKVKLGSKKHNALLTLVTGYGILRRIV